MIKFRTLEAELIKKLFGFFLFTSLILFSKVSFSAPCSIADYSADYTISIDCDELVLTEAFANTLTIDADISNTGAGRVAIDATSYALENLIINSSRTITSLTNYTIKYNNLVYGSILNNGTISAGGYRGVYVNGTGSKITTLSNTGTISAVGYAINVSVAGEVTTLLNTRILSTTSYVDITNQGTITNFYNDQGSATNDPVTFSSNLPTNYQIIINSTSDYGQVVFSSTFDTTNFGVHSTSSVDTSVTYSSVIDGLMALTSAELNKYHHGVPLHYLVPHIHGH